MTTHVGTSRIRPERRPSGSPFTRFFRPVPFEEWEDPTAAPAAHKGPDSLRPWTLRRGWQNLLWMYLFGLVFLLFSVGDLADRSLPVPNRLFSGVLVLVIALAYTFSAWMSDATLRVRAFYVGGFVAFVLATALWWGSSWTGYGVYVSIMIGA